MKTLLPFIFIISCSFTLQSQTKFGVKGGFNYSWFKEAKPENSLFGNEWKGVLGYHYGVFLQKELNQDDSFYWRAEGYITSYGARNENIMGDVRVKSFTLPLLFRLHLPEQFYIEGGIQGEYIISSNQNFITTKELTYGLLFGFGFKFERLGLTLRYINPFTDLYDYEFINPDSRVRGRARIFQLGAELYIIDNNRRSWFGF